MRGFECCLICGDKRHVGCHATCGDYLQEKADYERRKNEEYRESLNDRYIRAKINRFNDDVSKNPKYLKK